MRKSQIWICLFILFIFTCAVFSQEDEDDLLSQIKNNPASIPPREKLAELYLKQCFIEKSLNQWEKIIELDPEHQRATQAFERLSGWVIDLDKYLDVIEDLQKKGVLDRMEEILEDVRKKPATESQKARIMYIEGIHKNQQGNRDEGLVQLTAVSKLYPKTEYGGYALVERARLKGLAGKNQEALRLLKEVLNNEYSGKIRQKSLFLLAEIETARNDNQTKVSALRNIQASITDAEVKWLFCLNLARKLYKLHSEWVPECIDLIIEGIRVSNDLDEIGVFTDLLMNIIKSTSDKNLLQYLVDSIRQKVGNKYKDEFSFVVVEALFKETVLSDDFSETARLIKEARNILKGLKKEPEHTVRLSKINTLIAKSYLIQCQKAVALLASVEALTVLKAGETELLKLAKDSPDGMVYEIQKIAGLYEHIHEWEMAVVLYRIIVTKHPTEPVGRDMLLKIADIYYKKLDAPLLAVDTYAEYSGRFPAEFLYRDKKLTADLNRLGYKDVLDFQKSYGLNPDGIYGPKTRDALREALERFSEISTNTVNSQPFLLGRFIHPTIFKIAKECERKGRHREAIRAYHLFLNLFPTKKEADDALISIARLFRDNLLFHEAMGAYKEMINEFPKGNLTSEAYIEMGECLENLSRWEEAAEYYRLYKEKFPKYKHVRLCKTRLDQIEKIRQYEDFIKTTKKSPKLAEAHYQIGVILYEELNKKVKSAIEFRKVSDLYPDHIRAPEGLFMAGTALLHWQNFLKAREHFELLVKQYPQNRLADDGQFWIGHTYEYHARAIGKLDKKRIVLKHRSLKARNEIITDLELRRRYYSQAQEGPEVKEDLWDDNLLGVLTSGSKRDAVNNELQKAIIAYRKVVDTFKMGDMADKALLRIAAIYTDYLKAPEKGIAVYQELLENYPGSKEAEDALYEVGAYHMENRKYNEAVKLFKRFVHTFPKSKKAEDAMLAVAKCHVEAKEWANAIDSYQSYINKFPYGKYVKFAKTQIEWIRMYHF